MSNEIILAIISLCSALCSAFLLYRTNISKDKVTEEATLFESEGKFREVLLKEIEELMNRVKNLETIISILREQLLESEDEVRELRRIVSSNFNKMEILEMYCEKIPGPVWFKVMGENGLKMRFINGKYTEVWGVTQEYYEDKTDLEVWGEHIGSKFHEGDKLVLCHKRGHKIIEVVPNDPTNPESLSKEWIIWKFPVMDENKVVGVGGIAIDYLELKSLKNQGD